MKEREDEKQAPPARLRAGGACFFRFNDGNEGRGRPGGAAPALT